MYSYAEKLPNDPELLKEIILNQQQRLEEKAQNLAQTQHVLKEKQSILDKQQNVLQEKERIIVCLREQLNVLLQKRFGASTEAHQNQLGLFNEAEHPEAVETQAAEEEQALEVQGYSRQRRGKQALSKALPRVEVIHDLEESDKVCPHDGTVLNCIDHEISEQLDIIPASIQVIRHFRKKYTCPCCKKHLITAPLKEQPIPHSQVSADTLA